MNNKSESLHICLYKTGKSRELIKEEERDLC